MPNSEREDEPDLQSLGESQQKQVPHGGGQNKPAELVQRGNVDRTTKEQVDQEVDHLRQYLWRLGLPPRARNALLRYTYQDDQYDQLPLTSIADLQAFPDSRVVKDSLSELGIGPLPQLGPRGIEHLRNKLIEAGMNGLPIPEDQLPQQLDPDHEKKEREELENRKSQYYSFNKFRRY